MAVNKPRKSGTKPRSRVNKPRLGSGGRFEALSKELAKEGVQDPDALAAWIGRNKYGKGHFQALVKAGRKG